jgi:hypothetical protein
MITPSCLFVNLANPQASGYYRCVQDYFEPLEMHWQDCYAQRFGFRRPFVTDVFYRSIWIF